MFRAQGFVGIGFAILTFGAPRQMVVDVDSLPVHSSSTPDSRVVASLHRDEAVMVDVSVAVGTGLWCQISRPKDSSIAGWVPCRRLKEAETVSVTVVPAVALDPDTAIQEAIRLAGLERSFTLASDPAIYVGLAWQLTPQQIPKYRAIVSETSRPATFERAVKDTLRKNYAPELVPVLLEQLRSPLGNRMTQVWTQNYPPDPKEFAKYTTELRTAPPTVARVNLIRRITNAMGYATATVDIVATIALSGADGMNRALAPRTVVQETQVRQFVDWFRTQYGASFRDAAVSQSLYVFRMVPDEDLRNYVKLLESDAGRWFDNTVYLGMMYGFQLVTLEIAPEAVDLFFAKPSR